MSKKILKKSRKVSPALSVLARLGILELADVVDDGLAEAVDVHPRAVAYAVAGGGNVNHVALAAWGGDAVVRLLIGDDDDAVVALVNSVKCGTQVSCLVRLARLHRIAQSESAPRRDALCCVREGVDGYLLGDLPQEHGEAGCCVGAEHLRPARQRCDPGAPHVPEDDP